MLYGPTSFRIIVVKPYYEDELTIEVTPIQGQDAAYDLIINVEPELKAIKRGRSRPRKNVVFLIVKEKADSDLSLKLRNEGKISILGEPFE